MLIIANGRNRFYLVEKSTRVVRNFLTQLVTINMLEFHKSPGMKLHRTMLVRVAAMATGVEIATNMLDQDSLRVG